MEGADRQLYILKLPEGCALSISEAWQGDKPKPLREVTVGDSFPTSGSKHLWRCYANFPQPGLNQSENNSGSQLC